jgi:hypothetical protein
MRRVSANVSRKSVCTVVVCSFALLACSDDQRKSLDDGKSNPGGMGGIVVAGGSGNASGEFLFTTLSPLLRLTQSQYRQSAKDLLGIDAMDVSLPPDGKAGLFSSNAGLPLTLLGLDQYAAAAATLAARAQPRIADLAGCTPKAPSEESACVLRLLESLLPRAYARPINKTDSDLFVKVFTVARQDLDYTASVSLLLEALLQSPEFLYRVQRGQAPQNDRIALSSYELAARIGSFLGDSIPDDQLLQAARKDELKTDDQLRAQVERLWKSNKSTAALTRFHRQWLGLEKLDALSKDPKRYPFFDDNARLAMRQEVDAFVDFVLHKGGGHLRTLLSAPIGFPSGSLYRVYGLVEPAGHMAADPLGLPPIQRAGLLTLPAVMATHATADLSSPVHRGLFVFRNLLCQDLPPPPSGVNATPIRPDPEGKVSRRALFAQHEADPSCGSCHKIFDPLGFAFESYDSVGAFRTMDADEKSPVDSSATIATGTDIDGAVPNALALIARISTSRDVHDCYVRQWWTFAMGRPIKDRDEPVLATLANSFAADAGDVRSLLTNIVLSEDFRTRQGVQQ